ncbi:unnamed protein product [[Actinomadura] parvosata subsp. kistnae]|nr:unnamed protein product [Actinomadura parvosata subsp. kistnae]
MLRSETSAELDGTRAGEPVPQRTMTDFMTKVATGRSPVVNR